MDSIIQHKVLDMVYHNDQLSPPFLFYINDLHNAIKCSQPLNFANDTRLSNIQSKISQISESLLSLMKESSFWLNENKIALNIAKIKVILLKGRHKAYDIELGLNLCIKTLNKTNHVRYIGIKIDENLNWASHVHGLASKLNRANSALSKLRHFVSSKILISAYFAIIQSHINYVCIA